MKKALITGINGQDGSYLAELLVKKGYEVHGTIRRHSDGDHIEKLRSVKDDIQLHYLELTDHVNIYKLVDTFKFGEIYNLAAQSFVALSFEQPIFTANVNAIRPLSLLDAIRKSSPNTRFYQASTSEMFGDVDVEPQNEQTPFHPRSPYAFSKLFAHNAVVNYRQAYGLFACSGILFNHESPRRGPEFVTQKIVKAIKDIVWRHFGPVELGNLDSKRDWGHAQDYVQAMWMMLQQDKPEDFVISTGEQHTIRQFVETVCEFYGMAIEWHGTGLDEIGRCVHARNPKLVGKIIVKVNPKFFRPTDVVNLIGDHTKAEKFLGWKPSIYFYDLVKSMVFSDD